MLINWVTKVIEWVRDLRQRLWFKYSVRSLLITLLVAGTWVATRSLDANDVFNLNDKLIHCVVFFGLAMIMDLAISRKPFWFWKGIPLVCYGLGIEVLQYFSPNRSFSLHDLAADALGVVLYYLAKDLLLLYTAYKGNINEH